jgi:hypothetical protein
MEKALIEKTAEDLETNLAEYQKLAERRSSVVERLDKVESERGSVREHIYNKVRGEYQTELGKLDKQIKPLEKEVEKAKQALTNELMELEDELKKLDDRFEEFSFRHRVGEFDNDKLAQMEKPAREEADKINQRKDQLNKMLERIDPPAREAKKDTTNRGRKTDEKNAEPDAPARPSNGGSGEQRLVDPADWMDEILDDDVKPVSKKGAAHAPSGSTKREADLSDLADPSDDASPPAGDDNSTETTPRVAQRGIDRLPVLIISKGPGSGRKVTLAPMTMTVGREHDNNIELKDEDVARYHARISFEKGKYVLHDLESHSGTWVNDGRVNECELKHGDKLRVGSTELIVDFEHL